MITPKQPKQGPSRRTVLGSAAAGVAVGLGAGLAGGRAMAASSAPDLGTAAIPFHGPHQAGIVERQQAKVQLAAYDLAPTAGHQGLRELMGRWSKAAERLTRGEPPAGDDFVAADAGPCSLTITFGFGASLFDRTGLTARRPAALAPLPAFPEDALDPARSDGDLWVQLGADDALVLFHAQRTLLREAAGLAVPRWQMGGFSRTPGSTAKPLTDRNLMGQLDGTNNPDPKDGKVFATGPDWMAGGTYLVQRRIRMLLNNWDNLPTDRQERVIGRRKSDGAPLSGGTEHTPADLTAQHPDGTLAVPADAHIRLAAPAANGGAAMLRRGFSYADGLRPDGEPDAGLLFLAFQADPAHGFVPVQRRLARGDSLSRFLRHEASGVFAVPPGAPEGGYVGQQLLEG